MRKTKTRNDDDTETGKGNPLSRYLAIALNHMTPSPSTFTSAAKSSSNCCECCCYCQHTAAPSQPFFLSLLWLPPSTLLNSLCGYKIVPTFLLLFNTLPTLSLVVVGVRWNVVAGVAAVVVGRQFIDFIACCVANFSSQMIDHSLCRI